MSKRFRSKLKLKTLFSLCSCVLLLIATVSATALLFRPKKNEPDSSPTIDVQNPFTYDISYYAVEGGKVVELSSEWYKLDGEYPTSCLAGSPLYVDDLIEYIDISYNEDRTFEGWFTDAACTKRFENGKKYVNDVTLYAKISIGFWTDNY